MPGSWPKNGLFIVRAENGKYWAETLSKDLLGDFAGIPDEILASHLNDALESLQRQVSEHRKKGLLEICGKVIRDKAQA